MNMTAPISNLQPYENHQWLQGVKVSCGQFKAQIWPYGKSFHWHLI